MAKKSHKMRSKSSRGTASLIAPAVAKVFMTGRSQAVRLPKEYRFTGDSVHIKRVGNAVVLTPKTGDRWEGLFAALDEFPRGFPLVRNQKQPVRAGLADLFNLAED